MFKRYHLLLVAGALFLPMAVADPPEFTLSVGEERPVLVYAPAFSSYDILYDNTHLVVLDGPGGSVIPSGAHLPYPGLPGDVEPDDDFDLDDWFELQLCLGSSDPSCEMFDFDLDGTVDSDDLLAALDWFTGPGIPGDAEPDFDYDMADVLVLQRCIGQSGPDCARLDIDGSGVVDAGDFQLVSFTGPLFPPLDLTVPVRVWVRGTQASAAVNDSFLAVTSGPDYTWVALATVYGLSVTNPSSLELGDIVTLSIQPTGGLSFNAQTTASFSDPGLPLGLSWEASDVQVVSACEAVLIAGTGTMSADVDLFLNPPAQLSGRLTVDLGDGTLSANASFSLEPPNDNIYRVAHSVGGNPSLGQPVDELSVAFDNNGNVPSEADLLQATAHHHAIAVEVKRNAYTAGLSQLTVQVVTFTTGQAIVDSFPVDLDVEDPGASPLRFVGGITTPLIPFDCSVDRDALGYTQVIPFETANDGFAVVLPMGVTP